MLGSQSLSLNLRAWLSSKNLSETTNQQGLVGTKEELKDSQTDELIKTAQKSADYSGPLPKKEKVGTLEQPMLQEGSEIKKQEADHHHGAARR